MSDETPTPVSPPPTPPSDLLPVKLALFGAGAAFGIAGMYTRRDIFVAIGIAFLSIGIAIRIIESRREK